MWTWLRPPSSRQLCPYGQHGRASLSLPICPIQVHPATGRKFKLTHYRSVRCLIRSVATETGIAEGRTERYPPGLCGPRSASSHRSVVGSNKGMLC
jgi:hypothetical protein